MDYDNFDIHAENYEDTLIKALAFTGAHGNYYAERGIESIRNLFQRSKKRAPNICFRVWLWNRK